MALLNIPTKSTGDTFTATELNTIVNAIKSLQSEKGHAVYYDGQYTLESPQEISGSSFVAIGNNAETAIETFLPYGVDTLYDGEKILPPSVGSSFTAYIIFTAKANSANAFFELGIDIGGSLGVIFKNSKQLIKGNNTYQDYYIPINGFMADTFTSNGGIIKLLPSTGDTISIYGTRFFINIGYQQQ